MIVSRAPILMRSIGQITKNGNALQLVVKNCKQPVRYHGDWTYRSMNTQVPLWKRVVAQGCCGCKLNFSVFVIALD